MKKLEIIIRPDKLEDLKEILNAYSVGGMTVISVMGCGNQKGYTNESFKGLVLPNINLIPKIQVNVVVPESAADEILNNIHERISTGTVGDGKVFVYEVEEAMRIRTGERGSKVI